MTQKHRDSLKYRHKHGQNHILDTSESEFGRDSSGRVPRGLSGISHSLDSKYLRALLTLVDWHIAHADWVGVQALLAIQIRLLTIEAARRKVRDDSKEGISRP